MRILVIADTHFENKNELETNLMCDKIYEVALKQKPMYIVCLGDITHTHELLHMGPLNRALNFLLRLSQLTTHLYVLVGNHDRPNNTAYLTEDSPFVACKQWSNVTIVDKVVIKDEFVFVPYVPVGRFHEALATVGITHENVNNYKIIFAHQEFKNCKMGAITSIHGDEWYPDYPLCISGHIHDYQQIQHNMIYPGTPIQLGYGTAPSKGVMLVNVPSEGKIDWEFFDLGLPKKMIVHITPEELSKYKLPDNCFVKLVCKGDTKVIREITKLDSVKEMLKSNRVRLSIQEDRSKTVNVSMSISTKMETTVPFQKRLYDTVKSQNSEIQNLFSNIFGDLKS